MTAYRTMLDTNIVSDLMRNPHGKAAGRLATHGIDGVCLSIVTAAELRYGASLSGSGQHASRVEEILTRLPVVPFDVPGDVEYGALRTQLRVAGTPIGSNHLFIAAHALALGVALATDNVAEFRRVPNLRIENWLE